MESRNGKMIFSGVVIGEIAVCEKNGQDINVIFVEDVESEVERYIKAVEKTLEELDMLYDKALEEVGEEEAQIFMAQKLLACDAGYKVSVDSIIRSEKVCAEYAVACTRDKYVARFEAMEDEYLRARGADIKAVSERVLKALTNTDNMFVLTEPSIIVSEELTPGEMIKLDRRMVLGFVMETAAENSHAAILARSMGIPMITGVKVNEDWNGKTGALDAAGGCFYIEPDIETLDKFRKAEEEYNKKKELLMVAMKGKKTVTKDGRRIMLYANIGKPGDVAEVLSNDAEGIGLFRTEFLFLEREDYPTEEEQFQAYKHVAESLKGKRVIIRTLDIGADKKAGYFGLGEEENPALGLRGIRLCLERREIFKTQLRAILRAAAYGKVAVMFPMVASVGEVLAAKEVLEEAVTELVNECMECGEVEVGVMIETPAAALISDELAGMVDFFSIGTNDLTQYTLAVDRQNAGLVGDYDANHPAVIKLIDMVIKNAHAAGIWVGVCGEAAGDAEFAKKLVDMGVDELSVSPVFILKLRKMIINI